LWLRYYGQSEQLFTNSSTYVYLQPCRAHFISKMKNVFTWFMNAHDVGQQPPFLGASSGSIK